ncbi:glutamine-synthetase adenylyltransferase [Oceaniovalibus sp. ACAM 378]|uniref:[protein-PII] uridylyltransferase family protein n=1 Tax=Oceaniovalibus sp. ACAM 378 TaxID=2599923 RepID=UPI00210358B2|nr:glutamine-synthetase adenylyltransferase [Oceaniovalibus sp. ACAM 378]
MADRWAMTFAARLTRSPRPFEPERAAEGVAPFADLAPELRTLLTGAAGCSPFLKSLMEREADWLHDVLTGDPEASFDGVMADVVALEDTALAPGLRLAKGRVALLSGLADLGGVWTLEQVTGALTRFADLAVDRAMKASVRAQWARGRLPGVDEADLADAGGLFALAMGKMGAFELNYSSDIDLICLIDESRFDPEDFPMVRPGFVRATKAMAGLLSNNTADGYVFRTDLRLRPDPAVTPVALSMEAAERYYESLGRTWERAAHVKARPCAGDIAAGDKYLGHLRPFVWRRHLDFAAIQDAHDMRLRIREHRGLHGPVVLEGHDLKLGRGGIREIEFFTQTRQIIAGGRDPSLRVRGTVEGLEKLVAAGWVESDVAGQLTVDYRAHREVEHRIQMVADAQTHDLPQTDRGFARLAAMMDRDVADLRAGLSGRLIRVARLTEDFFAPANPAIPAPDLTPEQEDVVRGWRGYPALRSARAQEIFSRICPALLSRLAESRAPDRALTHLDGFLRGLPAGVQVFSLFEANPQLIDLVIDIVDTAPELAAYLARNAGVFDAVIAGSFFSDWPGPEWLETDLTQRLEDGDDYEARLDLLRAWAKEWKFRIGVHHLRGLIDGAESGAQYADVAEAVLTAVWPLVVDEFARKHGPPPGRGAMVMGMGSLGARRLNAASDLDLIVIYDPGEDETSNGPRPLAARPYFARLTQALVTALSVPMAEGQLYEVDMRLRPSGRQGPVATSLASYRNYQQTEAWTWEHLALTRSRPMVGAPDLCAEVEAFRRSVLAGPRDAAAVRKDTATMRARLAAAKSSGGPLDLRRGAGYLQDIELAVSALALLSGTDVQAIGAQLDAAVKAGKIEAAAADVLRGADTLMWSLHSACRLLSPGPLDPNDLGAGGVQLLLRVSGAGDLEEMQRILAKNAEHAAQCVADVLGKGEPED